MSDVLSGLRFTARMADNTIIEITDDIDGSTPEPTASFAMNGKEIGWPVGAGVPHGL